MYVCPKCGNKSFDGFKEIYTSNKVTVIHNLQTDKYDVDVDYEEFIECVCLKCGKPSFSRVEAFIEDVNE